MANTFFFLNRLFFVSVSALVSSVAIAGDYVWKGGSSGNWNASGNWNPTGVPTAGDTASFTSDVQIDDPLTIPSGTLTVNNSENTVIRFNGVISGEGALRKTGKGAIAFYADNTFSGGFTAGVVGGSSFSASYLGNTIANCNSDCGLVALHHGGGLGTALANVNTSLFIPGGVIVTTSLKMDHGGQVFLRHGNGDVTMAKSAEFTKSFTIAGQSAYELIFDDVVTIGSGAWLSFSGGSCKTVVFNGTFNGSSAYVSLGGNVEFNGAENAIYSLYVKNRVSFGGSATVKSMRYLRFDTDTGVLDLCGHDLELGVNGDLDIYCDGTKTGYAIHSDETAQLILGTKAQLASGNQFTGRFTGQAGLSYSKSGSTFTISGQIQPTRGVFSVSGTAVLYLTNGAGFSNLSELHLLKNNGTVQLSDTAADLKVRQMFDTWQWCRVYVGTGGKIIAKKLKYGDLYMTPGSYSKQKDQPYESDPNGGVQVVTGVGSYIIVW